MITLEQLNSLSESEAASNMEKCCVSSTWVLKMAVSRPFKDHQDVISKAADIWYNECSKKDFLKKLKLSQKKFQAATQIRVKTPMFTDLCGGLDEWVKINN
jgi:hypothetical protein